MNRVSFLEELSTKLISFKCSANVSTHSLSSFRCIFLFDNFNYFSLSKSPKQNALSLSPIYTHAAPQIVCIRFILNSVCGLILKTVKVSHFSYLERNLIGTEPSFIWLEHNHSYGLVLDCVNSLQSRT